MRNWTAAPINYFAFQYPIEKDPCMKGWYIYLNMMNLLECDQFISIGLPNWATAKVEVL